MVAHCGSQDRTCKMERKLAQETGYTRAFDLVIRLITVENRCGGGVIALGGHRPETFFYIVSLLEPAGCRSVRDKETTMKLQSLIPGAFGLLSVLEPLK